ncbi:MAG: helix-turn-helix domain-containing protein [Euryhalocaulis sp.]|uniref:Crp/Fnr family transcriptional regulator n=1 Tax=Euryhalocaulis sp. TaxID=2744307 RepID=UPI0017BE2F0D|nr:helix-turn-helix domain-containing protein [Euryhalocaulis sp.]MBA4800820.1 helix-turn-helix domain-containing protein [Euryhalocaulis sp.]
MRDLKTRQFAKAEPIYFAGDTGVRLMKVVSGAVMVFQIFEDGRRQITDFVTPGELLHFDFDGAVDHYAEALTEVELIQIEASAALTDPDWADYIFKQMRERLGRERKHVALLGCKSAAERLAEFLIIVSERLTSPVGDLELPMTRQQIADYTGLTIETVSRLFSRWTRERRLIPTGRRTYRIEGALAA